VLDEHMQAIKLLYPKEYDSIIEKIRDLWKEGLEIVLLFLPLYRKKE
jgi:hypothetical protein